MFFNLILIQLIIIFQYKSTFTTECFSNVKGWCEFRNVQTTFDQPLFLPSVSGYQKINRIFFTDCQIPIFTTETCTFFPELFRLDVEQVSLSKLNEKSLVKCSLLTYISFFNNKLETVNRDIFKGNLGLRFISFSWNKITDIDMSTFSHLYLLEELALDNNKITVVDFQLVGDLSKMSILHLGSNQLIDLNEKVLLNRFSSLTKIYIEDNLFSCLRVPAMLEEFQNVNVSIGKGLSYKRLEVHYERKFVQDIECLDSRAYSEMLARRIGSKIEAERVPIMKEDDDKEESNPNNCWYIGGGIAFVLVLVIIVVSICCFRRKRRQEMANGDYYYDYQTQEKCTRESEF